MTLWVWRSGSGLCKTVRWCHVSVTWSNPLKIPQLLTQSNLTSCSERWMKLGPNSTCGSATAVDQQRPNGVSTGQIWHGCSQPAVYQTAEREWGIMRLRHERIEVWRVGIKGEMWVLHLFALQHNILSSVYLLFPLLHYCPVAENQKSGTTQHILHPSSAPSHQARWRAHFLWLAATVAPAENRLRVCRQQMAGTYASTQAHLPPSIHTEC